MLLANVPAPAAKPEEAVQQAPAAPAKKPGFGEVLEPALWLAGALLVAALAYKIVGLIRNAQFRKAAKEDSAHGQLAQFREAFERGEMSEQEFDRVHKLLTGRVKKEAGLPAGTAQAAPGEPPVPKPPETPSGNGPPQ